MLLHVHRDCKDYEGRGAQDGHLDFHTAPDLWPNNNVFYTAMPRGEKKYELTVLYK